jgi:hypothetical protein
MVVAAYTGSCGVTSFVADIDVTPHAPKNNNIDTNLRDFG